MKTPALLVLLSASLAIARESDFEPMFPKDGPPAGWVVRHWADIGQPAQGNPLWTIKDGVLTSSGDRGCWLISEKEYADFELEYEFCLGPLGNSGLALRCPATGDPSFDGMELQMADLRYNPSAKPSELTGGIYRAIAPSEDLYKPQTWNHLRISLIGAKLRAELNGKVIQDTDLSTQSQLVLRHDGSPASPLKDRPRKGRIGFQNLSRDGGQVEIRGAKIKVIKNPG